MRTFVLTSLFLGLALLPGGGLASPAHSAQPEAVTVRPEVAQALSRSDAVRVIVNLNVPAASGRSIQDLDATRREIADQRAHIESSIARNDLTISHRYASVPALAGTVTQDGLDALAALPEVASIEIDGIGEAATNQSGALIHAPEVHAAGLTGDGVVVAVLDSGIDVDHPDLAGDIAYERCYLIAAICPGGEHPADDDNGHGTNVSGIITSTGTVAPKGIAPDAQIAAYKVLGAGGTGLFSDWVLALDDIITNHPEVDFINMSLQSTVPCPVTSLIAPVDTLRSQDVLTFISAGNHGTKNGFTAPACVTSGISVGAVYDASIGTVGGWKTECVDRTTSADDVTCWSDSHAELDLLAPGAAITSTGRGGATSTYYGTSQAAPHAAAVAALLRQAEPTLTVDQIEWQLEASGRLVTDDLNDTNSGTNRTTPRVDARVALLASTTDADADGCSNAKELGASPRRGGLRNPLDPYDFYDVNGDKAVDLFNDVLRVAAAYGQSPGNAGYASMLDRSAAPPGTNPWDMGPPDGEISLLTDVLGAAAQFGHDCQSGP